MPEGRIVSFGIILFLTLLCLVGGDTNFNRPIRSQNGGRLCGTRLADALREHCRYLGGHNDRRPSFTDRRDRRGHRTGVVQECCWKQCSYKTLTSYCRNGPASLPPSTYNAPVSQPGSSMEESKYGMTRNSQTSTVTAILPTYPTYSVGTIYWRKKPENLFVIPEHKGYLRSWRRAWSKASEN